MKASKYKKSFIEVQVSMPQLDPIIKKVIRAASKETRKEAATLGAEAMVVATSEYYKKLGRDHWTNAALETHGGGRKLTRWWEGTVNGWAVKRVSATGAVISNSTKGLAHKVTGGIIKPVKRKYLAIPLVPEAYGMRPKEFANRKRKPLRKVGGAMVYTDKKTKKNIAVYALKTSVRQKPWRSALPSDDIGESFSNAYLNHILSKLM